MQSYLASSGYNVKVETTRDGVLAALDADPSAITVIALDADQQELLDQAVGLRRTIDHQPAHIFILSTEETGEAQPAGIDVIPRPYRLSELVRRIQALAKEAK